MVVLAWIGQIVLFFIAWKLFHLCTDFVRQAFSGSLWMDLITNVIVAFLFLLFFHTLHSFWWLMVFAGALVGIITGLASANAKRSSKNG